MVFLFIWLDHSGRYINMDVKKMRITVEYNPVDSSIAVCENDFTHIEAFGILTAAIQSIGRFWTDNSDLIVFEDERDEE